MLSSDLDHDSSNWIEYGGVSSPMESAGGLSHGFDQLGIFGCKNCPSKYGYYFRIWFIHAHLFRQIGDGVRHQSHPIWVVIIHGAFEGYRWRYIYPQSSGTVLYRNNHGDLEMLYFKNPLSCARLFFGPERNVACCRTGPGPPLRSLRSAWKKRDQRWGQFCGFASMTSWPQHRYEKMAAAIKMIEVGLINLTVCDYDQPWQWQAGKPICRILTVGFLVCFSQGSLCSNSFPSARI